MPKESSALYGLSYYNIIIRPLIKIILNTTQKDNDDYINFLKEASKKAFLVWTTFEQNHNEKILNLIDNVLKNSLIAPLEEWDKQIITDASTRLFKNHNIPEKVINISKEKVPRLLELIYNAPIHIITKQISNYLLKKPTEQRIRKKHSKTPT